MFWNTLHRWELVQIYPIEISIFFLLMIQMINLNFFRLFCRSTFPLYLLRWKSRRDLQIYWAPWQNGKPISMPFPSGNTLNVWHMRFTCKWPILLSGPFCNVLILLVVLEKKRWGIFLQATESSLWLLWRGSRWFKGWL